MSDSPPRAERTIEELLGMTTDRLLRLSTTELESYLGDCLTRQEEILGKVPRKTSAASIAVDLGNSSAAKQRALRNSLAALPDEDQAKFAALQEMYDNIKKKGLVK